MTHKNHPVAEKILAKRKNPFETLEDPWQWIEDIEDKKVRKYLEDENNYTSEHLKHLDKLCEQVFGELKARIREEDESVPYYDEPYYYYSKTHKDQEYPVFKRYHKDQKDNHEVLLDVNSLAEKLDYCDVAYCSHSPNHRYIAYAVDNNGDERYSIYIKDLEKDCLLSEVMENAYDSLEWTQDSNSFYYNVLNEKDQPKWVYNHTLYEDPSKDLLIFEEKDPRYFVSIDQSENEKSIFIAADGNNSSEVFWLDSTKRSKDLKCIIPRSENHEYEVSDHNDYFIVKTNKEAWDNRIVRIPKNNLSEEHWQELVPHKKGLHIESFIVFQDFLVWSYKEQGVPKIDYLNFAEGCTKSLDIPHYMGDASISWNCNFACNKLRFSNQGMNIPPTLKEFDLVTMQETTLKVYQPPDPEFNPENYLVEKLYAQAEDGENIPITLLRKNLCNKNAAPDAQVASSALVLYAYGSYGLSTDPLFDLTALNAVDHGLTYAIAHIRGGMEKGRDWYENGKLLQKKNTFNDYYACCNHLIEKGYTQMGGIIAHGGSAGGLLMGVIANEKPDFFKAIIAQVPFVDTLNTMLNSELPLTPLEYNEWGNPNEKSFYEYIKSYSPYDNVKRQDYPNILAISGLNDTRVPYWEATKWVAKLRVHHRGDQSKILLKTQMDSGHGGASGRYEELKETAFELAYMIDQGI